MSADSEVATPPPNSTEARTVAEWRAWLEQHHTQTAGVWLITYKKASSELSLSYDASVEEALCFGWIDSKGRKLDNERSMLWFAPRKPHTGWSRPNKERIERLVADGRMAEPGLAKIRAAQQDGSWTALDAVEALEVPDDLAAAFAAYPDARQHFDAFPRSAKRGILEWISTAKTAPTRTKRIEETARLAQTNERANQWRK